MLYVILNKRAKFSQIVNGNVKWYFKEKSQVLSKLFMWMLHDYLRKGPSSQTVYVNVTWYSKEKSQVIKLFMWMLHIIFSEEMMSQGLKLVIMYQTGYYVNVTHYILKQRAKFSNCFCEDYMIL
jgi:hypothetical protein